MVPSSESWPYDWGKDEGENSVTVEEEALKEE
jgi:hypothetical protein